MPPQPPSPPIATIPTRQGTSSPLLLSKMGISTYLHFSLAPLYLQT